MKTSSQDSVQGKEVSNGVDLFGKRAVISSGTISIDQTGGLQGLVVFEARRTAVRNSFWMNPSIHLFERSRESLLTKISGKPYAGKPHVRFEEGAEGRRSEFEALAQYRFFLRSTLLVKKARCFELLHRGSPRSTETQRNRTLHVTHYTLNEPTLIKALKLIFNRNQLHLRLSFGGRSNR